MRVKSSSNFFCPARSFSQYSFGKRVKLLFTQFLLFLLPWLFLFSAQNVFATSTVLPSSLANTSYSRGTGFGHNDRSLVTSDGTIHAFLTVGSQGYLCGGVSKTGLLWFYSLDQGATWTCGAQVFANNTVTADAIKDASDNIYIATSLPNPGAANNNDVNFIKLTKGTGSTWTLGSAHIVFDGNTTVGHAYGSIALDSANRLWIATRYFDGTNYQIALKTADTLTPTSSSDWTLSSATFVTPTTNNNFNIPKFLHFGSNLALFYNNEGNGGQISWRTRADSDAVDSWSSEAELTNLNISSNSAFSVAVDANDLLHLLYNETSGAVQYRNFNGTDWSTPVQLGTSITNGSTLLKIVADGSQVVAVYGDASNLDANLAGSKRLAYRIGQSPFGETDFSAAETLAAAQEPFDQVWKSVSSVFSDQTAVANSSTAADFTFPTATNDALYFGKTEEFDTLSWVLSTAGVGGTITWQYWNGSSWANLSVAASSNPNFTSTTGWLSFTAPNDWATTSLNSESTAYYYVRALLSGGFSGAAVATQLVPIINMQNLEVSPASSGNFQAFWIEHASNPFRIKQLSFNTSAVSPTPTPTATATNTPTPTPTALPAPTLNGITPSAEDNDQSVVPFTVTGTNFQSGLAVRLHPSTGSDISATDIVVTNGDTIAGNFNLNGATATTYDLIVENPDAQTASLLGAFVVNQASGPTPTPTATATPTPTATPTATPTPTTIPTPTPTGAVNPQAKIVGHQAVALFDSIPSQYLTAAGQIKQIFMDRSVGSNISDGLTCLGAADTYGGVPNHCRRDYADGSMTTVISYNQANFDNGDVPSYMAFQPSTSLYNRSNWSYEFWGDYPQYGSSDYWYDKVTYFVGRASDAIAADPNLDAISFQFSYLEVEDTSDIANLSTGYFSGNSARDGINEIEAFEAAHPGVEMIYWTTSLARNIGTQAAEDFNQQVRDYALNTDHYVLDVADILSHDPAGNVCYGNTVESSSYPAICQDYTTETSGGHLGTVSGGKIAVAKAYWVLMACMAGWDGCANGASVTPTPTPTPTSSVPTPTPTVTPTPSQPAPTLISISPSSATNDQGLVSFTVTGSNFQAGADVEINDPINNVNLLATDISVDSSSQITGSFYVLALPVGSYDLVVTNIDNQSNTLASAFTIQAAATPTPTATTTPTPTATSTPSPTPTPLAAPSISGITPSSEANDQSVVAFSVSGSAFQSGATVLLRPSSGPDILATDLTILASSITGNFNLNGVVAGTYDLIVENPDTQSDTLLGAFIVTQAIVPTATPTATGTPAPTATDTPTPTATATPVPTATDTPTPTPTDTPTPTPTEVPPTNTPGPTATNTPVPTATSTPTPTPTPAFALSQIHADSTADSVEITWNSNHAASSQILYGVGSITENSSSESDLSPRVTSHSLQITGLLACTRYSYAVRSVNAGLQEEISSERHFTTTGCTADAPVIDQAVEPVASNTGGTLSLKPDTISGITLTIPTQVSTGNSQLVFQAHALNATQVLSGIGKPNNDIETLGSMVYQLNARADVDTEVSSFDEDITVTMSYSTLNLSQLEEASLWMYRYDGSQWHQLSNCVLDTNAKEIACQTNAFSVFAVFGTAKPAAASTTENIAAQFTAVDSACHAVPPHGLADLFEVRAAAHWVDIYFAPVTGNTDSYTIFYGYDANDERFNVTFPMQDTTGVVHYRVQDLEANQQYYFRVRANNGCATGLTSAAMAVKTAKANLFTETFYKYWPKNSSAVFTPTPLPNAEAKETVSSPKSTEPNTEKQGQSFENLDSESNSVKQSPESTAEPFVAPEADSNFSETASIDQKKPSSWWQQFLSFWKNLF